MKIKPKTSNNTMLRSLCFAALLLPNLIKCGLILDSSSKAFLIMGDGPSFTQTKDSRLPELKSMHVTANIRNRYARTIVETKYLNPEEQSQEATFTITLPDTAFISGFIMEIDGKKYVAYVKEKEEAKKEYQKAVERGQSAGHVAMSARDSKVFTVSVNVEPLSKVHFTLTYEQLLMRKHGKYEMVINLHPGQLVDDFSVDVNINETRRIFDVSTPALRSGNEIVEASKVTNNQFATISNLNDDETEVNINFSPSKLQQEEMMAGSKGTEETKGISGQFVVEYDVERDPQGGEVIVNDGHFVHFFAPNDLNPIPKHVVFVLDVSGSMMGRKIKQLREAMKVILGELNKEDYFHLTKFSTQVQVWNEDWQNINNPEEFDLPQPYSASHENIEKVKNVVENMRDERMTNIYDALSVALRLTSKGVSNHDNRIQPIIIFLTDGQANQGNSNYDDILKMVNSRNDETKAAIFCLSFGDSANKEFLKNVATQNLGFMRNIYESADASLQLEDFYRTISSPLLTDINFVYTDQVSNLTKNKFDILFKGSELVVAGKLTDSSEKFVTVEGKTLNGTHKFIPNIFPIIVRPTTEPKKEYGSLERLWAYMTIKQLLDKKYESKTKEENNSPEKEALGIALKYSFVTPVSSLIVVKPNSTESQEPKQPSTSSRNSGVYYSARSFSGTPQLSSRSSLLRFGSSKSYQNNIAPRPRPVSFDTASMGSHDTQVSYLRPVVYNHPLETDLPWLKSSLMGPDNLFINNNFYLIGNNATRVDNEPCQVNTLNISGQCTLLSACPKIFSALDTLDTYKKYFCALKSGSTSYAGVCCVDIIP